jgi:hypothetical protein
MWPSAVESCNPGSDYYCLDAYKDPRDPNYKCCWLSPLLDSVIENRAARINKALDYFAAMSEAYASTCSGEAYIMIEDISYVATQHPGRNPSLWITTELPKLQQRFARGDLFKLSAITGRPGNWNTQTTDVTYLLRQQSERAVPESSEFVKALAKAMLSKRVRPDQAAHLRKLEKRDCGAANQEDPHLDYFG